MAGWGSEPSIPASAFSSSSSCSWCSSASIHGARSRAKASAQRAEPDASILEAAALGIVQANHKEIKHEYAKGHFGRRPVGCGYGTDLPRAVTLGPHRDVSRGG